MKSKQKLSKLEKSHFSIDDAENGRSDYVTDHVEGIYDCLSARDIHI